MRSPPSWRIVMLLVTSSLACLDACSAILGFEDPLDLREPFEAGSPNGGDGATRCECISVAPPGWQGPLSIFEAIGSPLPSAPACAGDYGSLAYDGKTSPDAGPARCSCECAAPSGATCSPVVANFFKDPTCATPCGSANQTVASSCTVVDVAACGGTHVSFSASTPNGGACAPVDLADVPPVGWAGALRLCAPTAPARPAGCTEGQVCAASPTLPFEPATLCIARSEDVACPTDAGFPVRHVAYGGSADDRACSPCGCAPPIGVTCGGSEAFAFGGVSCSGGPVSFSVPSACGNFGGAKSVKISTPGAAGGSCTTNGGKPQGNFTPTTPTTVCCTR